MHRLSFSRILFLFVLLSAITSLGAQTVHRVGSEPPWVVKSSETFDEARSDEDPVHHLFYSRQQHLPSKAGYYRIVSQLNTTEGVQGLSNVEVMLDPTFQRVTFHSISVIRDGERIDKMSGITPEISRLEKNADQAIYDKSVQVIYFLSDIRVGDIIDYSYTVTGRSPAYKDEYEGWFYQALGAPIDRMYLSVLSDIKLSMTTLNDGEEFTLDRPGGQWRYTWETEDIEAVPYDPYAAPWDLQLPYAHLTTLESWEDVGSLFAPLYKVNPDVGKRLALQLSKERGGVDIGVLDVVDFVQNEIRYLGQESGLSAYKPSDPKVIMDRRFGDCKDKSYLLVHLLQGLGVRAHPMLVSIESVHGVRDWPPGNNFDHCIVQYEINGIRYHIDPTIAAQGGALPARAVPDYGYGLVLDGKSTELLSINTQAVSAPEMSVTETFDMITADSATLQVTSRLTGARADDLRLQLRQRGEKALSIDYENYYKSLYPGLSMSDPISFYESPRYNEVNMVESYTIPDIWSGSSPESLVLYYAELSQVLDHSQKNSGERLYTPSPGSYSYTTMFSSDNRFDEYDNEWSIQGDGYFYKNRIIQSQSGNLSIKHLYSLDKSIIGADNSEKFLQDHRQIAENLAIELTPHGLAMSQAGPTSFVAILAAVGLVAAIIFLLWRIHQIDPPDKSDGYQSVSPWFYLLVVGAVITVLFQLYSFIMEGSIYFSKALWSFDEYIVPVDIYFKVLLVLEFVAMPFYILAYSYLAYIVISRRTLAKSYTVGVLLINLVLMGICAGLCHMATTQLTDAALIGEYNKAAIRAAVQCGIWIPVLLLTEASHSMFCKRLADKNVQLSPVDSDVISEAPIEDKSAGDADSVNPSRPS